MSLPTSLTAKIKVADAELGNYVKELEKENLRLQNQLAKLQVKNVSLQNEVKALKKNAQPKDVNKREPFSQFSLEQLEKILKET